MAFKTITKDEIETQRIQSMCRVFERVDQVLAQQSVRCTTVSEGPAPAWSDGKTITFNRESIDGVTTVEHLIRLNGLNYHELCHILYTPRNNNLTVIQIRNEGLSWAFNLLEDQRIETLLTTEYPATIPYFISIMMRYIVGDESKWGTVFPFVHGRKYLPVEIRKSFQDKYVGNKKKTLAIAKIIDEYRKITFDPMVLNKRAIELVRAFKDMVSQDIQSNDPFAHDERPHEGISEGAPVPGSEQKEIIEKTEKNEGGKGEEGKGSEDDKEADAKGEGSGEGEEGEGEDEDGEGTGGGGDKEKSDEESGSSNDAGEGSDGDKEGDEEGENGNKGSGQSKSNKDDSESNESAAGASGGGDGDLGDAIERAIDEAENNEQVKEEINETQKAVKNFTTTDKGYRSDLNKPGRVTKYSSTPEMGLAAKKIASELSRLSHDLDPGFITHRSSGRLNLKRAMQEIDYDTAFDVWDQGVNTSTDMEVVILVDQSSSMNDNMHRVNQALWTIKRGVELASSTANVTVLGYNDISRTLIAGADRESGSQFRYFASNGGTDPTDALAEARYIFGTTRKERGVLITLTDGLWFGAEKVCNEMVSIMSGAGVTTALAFLQNLQGYGASYTPEEMRERFGHNHEIFTAITDPYALIKFSKEIVKIAMQKHK